MITAGILGFLLQRYPLSEIREQMAAGQSLAMVPFAIVAVVLSLALVASADFAVFRAALGPLRYWGVVKGKAATSMLTTLGYGFGAGGYGIWLARATGAGVRPTVGMITYVMLSDLAALCLFAGIAVLAGGEFLGRDRQVVFASVAWGLGGALVLAALLGPRVLRRLSRDPLLLKPWANVRFGPYVASVAGRMGNLAVAIVTTWAAAGAFGIEIPLGAMLAYLPVIFLIGALPVNVAGFGAVQAAWVFFFERWAPGAQILAFQFIWHVMIVALLIARGAPFLRGVLREIEIGRNLAAEADSEAASGGRPVL